VVSEYDYPKVMPGKLHLDPLPSLPAGPEAAAPDITMGVSSRQPWRFPTGGLPPWLSPDVMGPIFGHYAHGPDDPLTLPADFPGPSPTGAKGRWGKNDAGLGLRTRDWHIGAKPTGETSDRFDSPGTRDRAERVDRDERDARSRGETVPDPVGDNVMR
jgi:hypothetical protein